MRKAYASYFTAYLLMHLPESSSISRIILFGSVAKGEDTKESDIDIFIEGTHKSKKWLQEIEKITENFYKSREALLFKAKGIDNKINIMSGKLEEWKDLKKSIESSGMILYGKYISAGIQGKKFALIFWDLVGKNRGSFLNKLYGFRTGDKRYLGLLDKRQGKRVGKSCIMIPIEHSAEVLKLTEHHKVKAQIIEIYV
ncbi:TPA: nucleotidyltransferase domain-containing protein [Candidatus Woesearchaeota archaeon]|nr:nucleotidyltransferase domain-containing protein [Candidatus Woesearchaeota archaeon]HIG93852.1 nucleotidyltransferase domain-containing protein [Candidatus Woesearchaeota archaeon]